MINIIKIILPFLFVSITIIGQDSLFSFSGKIREYDSNEPVALAHIIIPKLNRIVSSDRDGYFLIDSIPSDIYEIQIKAFPYIETIDTIDLLYNLEKDLFLKLPFANYSVQQIPEFENYHRMLEESSGLKPIVEFRIDSLKNDKRRLMFYSSFKNNTDFPVYILKEKECVRPFEFHIYSSSGERMKHNMVSLSCDEGFFYNPDSLDLIKIPSNSIYNYPMTPFWLYSFNNFHKDTYKISILYEYKNPLEIQYYRRHSIEQYSSAIYAARIGLRGKYKSINIIKYKN